MAWWEAGLLDPRGGETEESYHAGRWRRQKWPDEHQAAVEKEVEEEKIDGYKLQRKGLYIENVQEGSHQICSFKWADNYWVLSQKKENLRQMMKELVEHVL